MTTHKVRTCDFLNIFFRYTHRGYSFYVFPNSTSSRNVKLFCCQTSSIKFLSEHGFDFNKLFKDGVSYLSTGKENYCHWVHLFTESHLVLKLGYDCENRFSVRCLNSP